MIANVEALTGQPLGFWIAVLTAVVLRALLDPFPAKRIAVAKAMAGVAIAGLFVEPTTDFIGYDSQGYKNALGFVFGVVGFNLVTLTIFAMRSDSILDFIRAWRGK